MPKAFEVRVTMVGTRPLAVAICADSDHGRVDWRSDYAELRYERVDVPEEVTGGMVAYLAQFGLAFGAFDFVVTPDERWIMLECDPVSGSGWKTKLASRSPPRWADLLTSGT